MDAGDLLNANCRIAGMWPIPGPSPSDELMNALSVDDELPRGLHEIIERLGWSEDRVEDLLNEDRDAWNSLFEHMIGSGQQGWVVQVETPVYERHEDSNSVAYSWGTVEVARIFAPSVTEALERAVAWCDERYEAARIDARTGRPVGDRGTAEQAIEYALDGHYHDHDVANQIAFLKAWREGAEFEEWPDFYHWLAGEVPAPASIQLGQDVVAVSCAANPPPGRPKHFSACGTITDIMGALQSAAGGPNTKFPAGFPYEVTLDDQGKTIVYCNADEIEVAGSRNRRS